MMTTRKTVMRMTVMSKMFFIYNKNKDRFQIFVKL